MEIPSKKRKRRWSGGDNCTSTSRLPLATVATEIVKRSTRPSLVCACQFLTESVRETMREMLMSVTCSILLERAPSEVKLVRLNRVPTFDGASAYVRVLCSLETRSLWGCFYWILGIQIFRCARGR